LLACFGSWKFVERKIFRFVIIVKNPAYIFRPFSSLKDLIDLYKLVECCW
jgi:hypothetical protein